MGRLERAMFASNKKMVEADAGRMEMTTFETVMNKVLCIFKWTRAMVACIGLAIMAENMKIRDRFLSTMWKTNHRDMQVEARNVWMEADSDTILSLTFPQADKFKCLDRGLYSDYLSSE